MNPGAARLLGFVVKRPWRPDGAWFTPGFGRTVRFACSVSDCLARRPPDDFARLNAAHLYGSRADALARTPTNDPEGWVLFAYRLLPVRLAANGREQAVTLTQVLAPNLPTPKPEDDLSGLNAIGWDVVSHTLTPFECSPLSCNNLASEVPVNQYCLLDDPSDALTLARRCDREQPEPGTYHVVQVLAALTA